MLMPSLKRTLGAGLLVFFISIMLVAAVLYTPFASGLRTAVAAYALTEALERQVEIGGDVTVGLGPLIGFSASDIRLARRDPAANETPWHAIDHVDVKIPLHALLSGDPKPSAILLRGVTVYLAGELPENAEDDAVSNLGNFAGLPTRLLTDPMSEDLVLEDIVLIDPDKGNGWGYEIVVDKLSSQASASRSDLLVEAKLRVDDTPATLLAVFTNPHNSADGSKTGPFDLQIGLPGGELRTSGDLDLRQPIAAVAAKLEVSISSLGNLLDLLDLRRVIEGTASMTASHAGSIDALAMTELQLDLQLENIASVSISGAVQNMVSGEGADLEFAVDVETGRSQDIAPQSVFQVDVERFSGAIKGDRERFFIADLTVQTNLASGELQRIGPVQVDRIVRDPEGKLALLGLSVVAGQSDPPVYAFDGNMRDALQLQGIDVEGRFNLDTAQLLGWPDPDQKGDLGRLQGTLSLSDESGTLSMTHLKLAAQETSFFSLALDRQDFEKGGDIYPAIRAAVNVPDIASLGNRLGLEAVTQGQANFTGHAYYGSEEVGFSGELAVDETRLSGDLSARRADGYIALNGGIFSELVHLKDIQRTVRTALFLSGGQDNQGNEVSVEIDTDLMDALSADLTIQVDRIAEAGEAASGLEAQLSYRERLVRLDPVRFQFIGGSAESSLDVDLKSEAPNFSLDGRIEKLKLGALLSYLGLDPIVTGSVYASYDIKGAGVSFDQIIKSVSGKTAVSVWGGTVGSRIIDLSGMSLIRWMFGSGNGDGTAKLVCAKVPMSFKNGVGSSRSIVIETDNVQIVGGGSVDLKNGTIVLEFVPRAKRPDLVEIVTTFAVRGPLAGPEIVVLSGGGAGRAVAEIVSTPLNILGAVFGAGGAGNDNAGSEKPCVIPKASGPK
ncbi:AsmA family protein [Roseibium alexandrii]|uniref:Uncharacterized protein involved in outer membrane biogenesis n=1 Tax=Roseibium alexandrii (strain DSM 17067 / NCIMB 14079 / DFL-11) TaxID=244592 RepID=A0A5E8H778_ROSAD|nr:AsmA-like C-terminal region-containing protein [Roseibium alexandrii]EEE48046.1 Uncharacterized protein involved in outer membrane biogenesis [Roseibium alexandrii DFL-11]